VATLSDDLLLSLDLPSPAFVLDSDRLVYNAKCLEKVQSESGCSVLFALKAFSCAATFDLIRPYVSGVAASGLFEARLGAEHFGKDVHVCGPAYSTTSFSELLGYSSAISFNSFQQWKQFRSVIRKEKPDLHCGIRVNPESPVASVALYDPCGPCSRLGVTQAFWEPDEVEGISGLHVHALCEQYPSSLRSVVAKLEENFGDILYQMAWLNLGGGHLISEPDYPVSELIEIISGLQKKYKLKVILEPGEAIARHAGYLVTTVLDIVDNGNAKTAVLDTSFTCHMPDVLEMPYKPAVIGALSDSPYTYLLGGMSCLAGDYAGPYFFPKPLEIGQRIIFKDMAHYTMVKTNTFNGVPLPDIVLIEPDGRLKNIRHFGYGDFLNRL